MSEAGSDEGRYWPVRRYAELYERSLADPEAFWVAEARRLEWSRTWDRVLDWSPPFAKWFVGGELNASYICLDRHLKGPRKNKVAIYWEGEDGARRVYSYAPLHREVNRAAAGLRRLGVGKGDAVALYLPMVPELPIFMLACARIGAVHTVVFSGFGSHALADRINDTGAKVVVTADAGLRRGRPVHLKALVDEALTLTPAVERTIVVRRTGSEVSMVAGRDVWLEELLGDAEASEPPVAVESNHPLFVLYTAGTTGKPKGIVHGTGGYLTFSSAVFQWAFDLKEESVYWCTADAGWITGHSAIVYGPLAQGATLVIYEGAPDYPSLDRWWQIIERYSVTALYTSPTAIRMFMQHGEPGPERHDLSSLEMLGSVGEPINPEAWHWYFDKVGGGRCPIVDTWWQTETGGFMIGGAPAIERLPMKPGVAGLPYSGIDVDILDESGASAPAGEKGFLVIKQPWPGMLLAVHGDPERYRQAYWERFPGSFYAGDYAVKDSDGYVRVLGRADEVLKVAGHRLGSMEIENAAVAHAAVAEAAAVAVPDPVKGEGIAIFAVLLDGYEASEALERELSEQVRAQVGPFATPQAVYLVRALPKTRSGKIMRRVLRAVASDEHVGDITTLEDETSVDEVKRAFEELKRQG